MNYLIFFILTLLGGVFLFIAIIGTRKILNMLEDNIIKKHWVTINRIMIFALFVYFISFIMVLFGQRYFLYVFFSLIFLFGFFMVLVVRVGYLTMLEMKKNQEAAEKANKFKSDFLANMSHELRTPLNAIIGYSEMLQEDADDLGETEFVDDAQKINKAGKHLLSMINDILDLSKIESGRLELYVEILNIDDLIKEVEETVQPLIKQHNNKLVIKNKLKQGIMNTDITKVRQTLYNLLSNASKFTENGTISIEVESTKIYGKDGVAFHVKDTGIGMSKEHQAKLFQAFVQADPSTTRKFGGTGLGLAISMQFCKIMNGLIEVKSEEGIGSEFIVRLPLNNEESELKENQLEERKYSNIDDGYKVLVIDDDPSVRDLLQRLLEKEGCKVITAEGGDEGLRLAHKYQPNIITLDVIMPGIDGWHVLSQIKSNPTLKETPVILVTISDDKTTGYAMGASDFITKPVDGDQLKELLNKYNFQNSNKILIVEDDKQIQDMMVQFLAKEGWEAKTADNGLLAIEQMEQEKPDLIVLDLMMPEMDGFEFVAEIFKKKKWRDIPVIVLTAKDITKDERERLNKYVETVIQKGAYNQKDLQKLLKKLISSNKK